MAITSTPLHFGKLQTSNLENNSPKRPVIESTRCLPQNTFGHCNPAMCLSFLQQSEHTHTHTSCDLSCHWQLGIFYLSQRWPAHACCILWCTILCLLLPRWISRNFFKRRGGQQARGHMRGIQSGNVFHVSGGLCLLAPSLFHSAPWIPAVHMSIFSVCRKLAVATARFPSPPQTK